MGEWVSQSEIHSFRFGDSYRISELVSEEKTKFVINIYGWILLVKKSLKLSDFLYLEEERWRVSMEEEEERVEEEVEEEVEERGATEEVAATWNDGDDDNKDEDDDDQDGEVVGWEGGPHCALGQPQVHTSRRQRELTPQLVGSDDCGDYLDFDDGSSLVRRLNFGGVPTPCFVHLCRTNIQGIL